jgi:spore germination cell wall hydrolase CwlJ-like protein
MKKIICIFAILLSFLFNGLTLNSEAEQNVKIEQEIIHVMAKPIPVVELKKEKQEEVPMKTITEIKNEEFNRKLGEIKYVDMNNEEWFKTYKELSQEYSEWVKLPETIYDAFSEEEINLICRVVETETFDQDFDSKVNVACVVFNRLESGKFGNSITEIVTNPKQFAYGRKKITESTILAVEYAYVMGDTTQGALYFNSFKEAPEVFNGANYIDTDKAGHHFYKPKED